MKDRKHWLREIFCCYRNNSFFELQFFLNHKRIKRTQKFFKHAFAFVTFVVQKYQHPTMTITKSYLKHLTYLVNGAAIEVHRKLGPGLLITIFF